MSRRRGAARRLPKKKEPDDGEAPTPRFAREAPRASERVTLTVEDRQVSVSHPKRIYYPELKLSKRDVVDFYLELAPYILPYLKDRPFVLHRFPRGIDHEDFYQKDNPQERPDWVESVQIYSEHNDDEIDYLLCQNAATLVYLVNLGCQEMNPWNSRVRSIDNPDWMLFDLDPLDIEFAKVIEVARVIHAMFEGAGIPHYCKTSGKRGLHIAVPLDGRYDNDTVRTMAENVAGLVHQELPRITSLERSPAKRKNRIYLDYLQNGFGKTLVSVYSLRPVAYAGVSTPLHWDEVKPGLDPKQFNFHTIRERLVKEGDLWAPMLGQGFDLSSLL